MPCDEDAAPDELWPVARLAMAICILADPALSIVNVVDVPVLRPRTMSARCRASHSPLGMLRCPLMVFYLVMILAPLLRLIL